MFAVCLTTLSIMKVTSLLNMWIAINRDLEPAMAEKAVVYSKVLCWNIVEETEENSEKRHSAYSMCRPRF